MKIIIRMILLLALGACSGDNTTAGNPPKVSLSIQATAPASLSSVSLNKSLNNLGVTLAVRDVAGNNVGSITLTDARVALKEIEFANDTDSESDIENEVDFEGPFVVDLLLETITPSLSEIDLPDGLYNEVEIALDKIGGDELDEEDAPIVDPTDELFDNSIYVEGLYSGPTANEGAVTDAPFSVSFDLDQEFELTGINDNSVGFEVVRGATNNLILAFRLNKWFKFNDAETNGSALEPGEIVFTSGSVELDENSVGVNASIREVIINNIRESLDYGKDLDDDGDLDTDEDDDPDDEDDDDD